MFSETIPSYAVSLQILFKSRFQPFYIAAVKSAHTLMYRNIANGDDTPYYLYSFARIFVLFADADDSLSTFQISDLREFVSILYVLFIDEDKNMIQKKLNQRELEFQNYLLPAYEDLYNRTDRFDSILETTIKEEVTRLKSVTSIKSNKRTPFEEILDEVKGGMDVTTTSAYSWQKGFTPNVDARARVWKDFSETRFRTAFRTLKEVRQSASELILNENTQVDYDEKNFTYKIKTSSTNTSINTVAFPLLNMADPLGAPLHDCESASTALKIVIQSLFDDTNRRKLVRFHGITCDTSAVRELAETLPITGNRFIPLSLNNIPLDDDGNEISDNGEVDSERIYSLWAYRRRTTLAMLLVLSSSFGTSNFASMHVRDMLNSWAQMAQTYGGRPRATMHIVDEQKKITREGNDRICEVLLRCYQKLYMLRDDPKIPRPSTTGYATYCNNIYQSALRTNTFPIFDPYNIASGPPKITEISLRSLISMFGLSYPQSLTGVVYDVQSYLDQSIIKNQNGNRNQNGNQNGNQNRNQDI